MAEIYGKKADGRLVIDLKLSQGELGNYIGMSRENINRQLSSWRDQGYVTTDKGLITLLDEDALREIGQSETF